MKFAICGVMLAAIGVGSATDSFARNSGGAEEYCSSPAFRELRVPVNPLNPARGTFAYKYFYLPPKTPDLPVIVYIPGGPGFGSLIETYSDEALAWKKWELGAPEGYGYLFHDPRGVDCSSPGGRDFFTDDELRSDLMAGDLERLIRELGLTDYVVYGHSYGTVVATHLAARLESGIRPRAVILSGVVGKASRGGESAVYKLVASEWETFKSTLPPQAVRRLSAASPLGIDGKIWGAAIETGLTDAAALAEGHWTYEFRDLLALLATQRPEDDAHVTERITQMGKARVAIDQKLASTPAGESDSDRVYQRIYCNELVDAEYDSQLEFGRVTVIPGSNLCVDHKLGAPFDSAAYAFSPPVFYFNGTVDPATSLADATYHFDHHAAPHRYLVALKEAGHHNLGYFFGDCAATFWPGLLDEVAQPGSGRFAQALEGCVARPQLTLREAH